MKSIVGVTVLLAALATCAPAMAQVPQAMGSLVDGQLAVLFEEPLELVGVFFISEGEHFIPIPPGDTTAPAAPFSLLLENNPGNVSFAAMPGSVVPMEGTWVTGIGYAGPIDTIRSDILTSFVDASDFRPFEPYNFCFNESFSRVCPEPSSNAIATIGALALLTLRRRRTA